MPTDLEVVEADEDAGFSARPRVPRGRLLVFAVLALTFVTLAVLSTFQGDRPNNANWVNAPPGIVLYRINQPHLTGGMYEISKPFRGVHDELCHQLKFSATGGAVFRARSVFMGLGRSHFGKIPCGRSGTNRFTLFAQLNGGNSDLALVTGALRRAPTHLLLLQHRPKSGDPYHTFPLTSANEHIYPSIRMSFATRALLSGAAVPTGDAFTNVVAYYESVFRPVAPATPKGAAFRIPAAHPGLTNSFTMFLQSSLGPKLIHVAAEGGLGLVSVVDFRR